MEGRVQLRCDECGKTRELSGEIPEEFTARFIEIVQQDGFVPRPGVELAFICGDCVMKYAGHETLDDEAKVRGKKK